MMGNCNVELKKLNKKHSIYRKINNSLLCIAALLFVLLVLEGFGIVNVPLYEQRTVFSAKGFLNLWIGIPYIIIEIRIKKIDKRIKEIESMCEKNHLADQ